MPYLFVQEQVGHYFLTLNLMIEVHKSPKGTPYVLASDLHKELEIATRLSTWFPRMIEYGFEKSKDFHQLHKKEQLVQGGFNIVHDWAVQLDMAKHIAMIQRTQKGKALREYLLGLDKKVQEGELLSRKQILALIEICKVLGLFSVQKKLETDHFEHFKQLNKDENWWQYRAKLFGYSADDLKSALLRLNVKYQNQRQALIKLDKYELVKVATIDLFITLGKTEEYSKNIAITAKELAKEMQVEIYNDLGGSIDFKTDKQKEIIKEIENRDKQLTLLDKF